MKYRPREIKENVNVSRTSPLREFFVLTLGIAGFLVSVYILLGLLLNIVVPRIPEEMEDRLAFLFASYYEQEEKTSSDAARLQQLLDELVDLEADSDRKYRVHLVPDCTVNAVALPGGHIVVFSGLVDKVESENELVMILGHELGHFRNRDHLRGLGRGLVLMFLSVTTVGIDSQVTKFLQSMLVHTEMKFSQKQELDSDAWGLELLVRMYGHAGGATDFFQRVNREGEKSRLSYFSATHPYPLKRVRLLESLIKDKDFPVLEPTPLGPEFHDRDCPVPDPKASQVFPAEIEEPKTEEDQE